MQNRFDIGVIQGRLSPRPPGGFQAFPRKSWKEEFKAAQEIGLSYIEWIFEFEDFAENPLYSAEGRALIVQQFQASSVDVRSICADYFLKKYLSSSLEDERKHTITVLKNVIEAADAIGAKRILLPLLEEADPKGNESYLIKAIEAVLPMLERYHISLGFEMEWAGSGYAALIKKIGHDHVGAYYDTGNSTAAGFDVETDIIPVLPTLKAIHIKDRRIGGTTLPLGQGDTNFTGLFKTLKAHKIERNLTLQHYFGNNHLDDAVNSFRYIKNCISNQKSEANS